jgi:hypothetical protein
MFLQGRGSKAALGPENALDPLYTFCSNEF